jgi:LysM repeat protein
MFFALKSSYVVGSLIALLLLGLGACMQLQQTQAPLVNTPTMGLTPYFSPTPSQEVQLRTPQIIQPTNPPTPTPTPITYTVIKGDTMLAIALRNGIDLEELLAANPEVNPRLLSVGTVLVIPIGEIRPSEPATATPIPIELQNPKCYPSADGSLCLVTITNDRSRPLENLSARIVLYNLEGENIAEGIAIALLNFLPVEESIPLVVFFPGKRSADIAVVADLISAQQVPRNDDRYLNVWIEVNKVELSPDGSYAEVMGMFGLPKKSLPATQIWIVAIAYNEEGEVVGVRKLEEVSLLEPGQSRPFSINLFSLGPSIDEVKVLAEARP